MTMQTVTKEQCYHVGVKAIIQNMQGEVLILKRSGKEFWDVPGGRVQVGEQPLATLRREVLEETGISDLEFVTPCELVMTPLAISVDDGTKVGLLLWYHTAQLKGADTEVVLSEEHSDFAWVSWKKVQELVSFFGAQIKLEYQVCCQGMSVRDECSV